MQLWASKKDLEIPTLHPRRVARNRGGGRNRYPFFPFWGPGKEPRFSNCLACHTDSLALNESQIFIFLNAVDFITYQLLALLHRHKPAFWMQKLKTQALHHHLLYLFISFLYLKSVKNGGGEGLKHWSAVSYHSNRMQMCWILCSVAHGSAHTGLLCLSLSECRTCFSACRF